MARSRSRAVAALFVAVTAALVAGAAGRPGRDWGASTPGDPAPLRPCKYDALGPDRCPALEVVHLGLIAIGNPKCGMGGGMGSMGPGTTLLSQQEPLAESITGEPIPKALADLRPLKPAASAAEVAAEGAAYGWLYQTALNLSLFADCSPENGGATRLLLPAGWALLAAANLPQDEALTDAKELPFAAVLANAATRQAAVVIRGTRSASEWYQASLYNQTTKHSIDYLSPDGKTRSVALKGATHHGFTSIYAAVAPAIIEAVLAEVARSKVDTVFVTGLSLGGGISQLVALGLQTALERDPCTAASGAKLGAVVFGSPSAGDAAFANAFNAAVNGRRLVFQADVVTRVPCVPRMFACRSGALAPAYRPNDAWRYAPVGGAFIITGADMPAQPDSWSQLAGTGAPLARGTPEFLMAAHVCSYACFTSQFTGDARSSCLLSNASRPDAGNTFCPGFPAGPPFP